MKTKQTLIYGFFAVILALTFTALSLTGCPPEPGPGGKAPEDLPYADRWVNKTEPSSTAKLAFSVASDGVCTIIVSGTPEPNEPGNFRRYMASAGYRYTAKTGTNYAYEFEAWTQSGSRTINVQYFYDPASGDYGLREYFINTQRQTFKYIGNGIPKGGEYELEFQCADQLGTFYVKVLSITETNENPNTPEVLPASERWWKYVDPSSTATIDYFSVDQDGVCTITIGGKAEPNGFQGQWFAWKAMAAYNYTSKTNTSYIYKFEAWTEAGARELHFQYYEDIIDEVYRNEDINISSVRTTYTVVGKAIPRGGDDALRFMLADYLGTVNIKMLSITAYENGTLTVTNFSGVAEGWITGDAYAYSEDGEIQLDFESGVTGNINTRVFDVLQDVYGESIPFTGNVTIPIGQLYIHSWGENASHHYTNTVPVTFINGSAAINFASQMKQESALWPVGTLTITGITGISIPVGTWGGGEAYFDNNIQIDKPDLTFRDMQIEGNSAIFDVWHIKYSGFNNPSTPANASGTVPAGKLRIYIDIAPSGVYTSKETVIFSNGDTTVSFSDLEESAGGPPGGGFTGPGGSGEEDWENPGDGGNQG